MQMKPESSPPQSTELSQLTETIEAGGAQSQLADPIDASDGAKASLAPLIDNYRAILQAKALYYPVAYQFVRELGRGRQGVVYLGIRQGARGSTTRHAIKLFDPSLYPSAQKYWTDMGRIAAQTSALQTVKSPNLVSPDSYEEVNGIGYVQMEAVNGVGLRYLLDGKHLDRVRKLSTDEEWSRYNDVIFQRHEGRLAIQPGVVIYIIRRVLRALEILHDKGFVHCDVKPANILLDQLGYVKLIDYGRATLNNERVSFLLGTPMYMAPEMHRREPAVIQSDLYTVGLVILEMLRGQPAIPQKPLSEKDLLEYKINMYNQLPALLPEYVRKNEAFVTALKRFLAPRPEDRFTHAQEAESGKEGLILVHKQLALMGKDTEYGRELEHYLAKLADPVTGDIAP